MKRNIIAYGDTLRITENLIVDVSSSVALDFNFSLRLFYFYKERDIQTLNSVSVVVMRIYKHGNNSLFLNWKLFHFCLACFKGLIKRRVSRRDGNLWTAWVSGGRRLRGFKLLGRSSDIDFLIVCASLCRILT